MPVKQYDRFGILSRDEFRCAYCGAEPGNDRLHVDHLVPQSIGGSDNPDNLITACDRCNCGKSDRVAVPRKLTTGKVDADGWCVWKTWGPWSLKLPPNGDGMPVISIGTGLGEYWIGLDRVHEPDWEEHLLEKEWCRDETYMHLLEALIFGRAIMDEDD